MYVNTSGRINVLSQGPYSAAVQWLLDQMHDPRVSLRHRITCAKTLIEVYPHEFNIQWHSVVNGEPIDPAVPVIKIVIEGLGQPTSDRIACDQDPLRIN
jgi:hypothetical protein